MFNDDIKDLVSDEMRQAAIDYWKYLHPNAAAIPIGEINGIIYAALSAMKNKDLKFQSFI